MKEFFAAFLLFQFTLTPFWSIHSSFIHTFIQCIHIQTTAIKTGFNTVATNTYRIKSIQTITRPASLPNFKKPANGRLSSKFGQRKRRLHTGIDIAAPYGTAIHSSAPGIVSFCGWLGRYGKMIIIIHANGMISRYGHCSRIIVKRGQIIAADTLIGKIGATGRARGSHLHFEIICREKFINPENYFTF